MAFSKEGVYLKSKFFNVAFLQANNQSQGLDVLFKIFLLKFYSLSYFRCGLFDLLLYFPWNNLLTVPLIKYLLLMVIKPLEFQTQVSEAIWFNLTILQENNLRPGQVKTHPNIFSSNYERLSSMAVFMERPTQFDFKSISLIVFELFNLLVFLRFFFYS